MISSCLPRFRQLVILTLWSALCLAQDPEKGTTVAQAAGPLWPYDSLTVFSVDQFLQGDTIPWSDTLLDYSFRQYDLSRRQTLDLALAGNLGSATRQIAYHPDWGTGWRYLQDNYNTYFFTPGKLPFHLLQVPFTQVRYSQGGNIQNASFEALFARNFNRSLRFTFNYHRINQLGLFQREKNRNTFVTGGLAYQHPANQYRAFLVYHSGALNMQHNGGVVDTIEQGLNAAPEGLPVFLSDAQSRLTRRGVFFRQEYRWPGKMAPTVFHESAYTGSLVKAYDADISQDSAFYRSLFVEERGMRHFTRIHEWSHLIGVRLPLLPLEMSAQYRGIDLYEEPFQDHVDQLILNAAHRRTWGKTWRVELSGTWSLLDQANDHHFLASLGTRPGNKFVFKLTAGARADAPTRQQNRLVLNSHLVWSNQFSKTRCNYLEASAFLRKGKTGIILSGYQLDNLVYFNSDYLPVQYQGQVRVASLQLNHDFSWWHLRSENTFLLQSVSKGDVLPLPAFFGRHSLAYEGYLFRRNMLVRLGADLRYQEGYQAPGFQFVLQQFYNQTAAEVPFYPALDVFLSLKVKTLRFFLKYENMNRLWNEERFYQIFRQPLAENGLRLGFVVSFRG